MNVIIEKEIWEELKVIRRELGYIKEHMVDVDTVLTQEEERILDESLREFDEGEATKLEDFEKELRK
jgi:ATP-dependent Lon protease